VVVLGGVVVAAGADGAGDGGFAVVVDGGVVVGPLVDGVVGVGGAEAHATNDVCGTNTLPPLGVTQAVPPGTNSTLPLPGGSPAGHCTLCP
jgi:hypothetical protein